ncbi:myo-inositol-1(or 4)-monophosphatase [Motilibacter rhizosphaerae]|uniref:Myo-inositol-1(Or 4)-monophosphatase n=1 Tax=Motilibacter rhizosphaerae TaxID=598652 RepID=A0A4Q7NWE7_9ACTN|nr:inositol monophosphatase family protein [Motilibacter rhizosphaerae]RZS91611.1 myo-inositol-1(or 4)-monophosphatase [Motilibacter rhizosphaerae]
MAETTHSDAELLPETVAAVRAAGDVLRARYDPTTTVRYASRDELAAALADNDQAALEVLRPRLSALRPGASWVEGELDGGALPEGEWWLVDPAEGNVNHLHGLTDWAVTATLVRDNLPVITVVHLPLTGQTATAVAGGGAYLDGRALQVSSTSSLGLGIVATSQARPDEDPDVVSRVAASIATMLEEALVVRVSVPATLHLLAVASGRVDAFWQYAGARADLLPGALLVSESGGRISDAAGGPWTTGSASFLAAAPGVHSTAAEALQAAVGTQRQQGGSS